MTSFHVSNDHILKPNDNVYVSNHYIFQPNDKFLYG